MMLVSSRFFLAGRAIHPGYHTGLRQVATHRIGVQTYRGARGSLQNRETHSSARTYLRDYIVL